MRRRRRFEANARRLASRGSVSAVPDILTAELVVSAVGEVCRAEKALAVSAILLDIIDVDANQLGIAGHRAGELGAMNRRDACGESQTNAG